jgi:hypothetical protein
MRMRRRDLSGRPDVHQCSLENKRLADQNFGVEKALRSRQSRDAICASPMARATRRISCFWSSVMLMMSGPAAQ